MTQLTNDDVYRFTFGAIKQNPIFMETMMRAFADGQRAREQKLAEQMSRLDMACMGAMLIINKGRFSAAFIDIVEGQIAKYYSAMPENEKNNIIKEFLEKRNDST